MKVKIDFKSYKKWSYPLNVILFNFCRLWPFRQKRLWVFGAWAGRKYDDNAKYMFQHVCEHHSQVIRAIWLTDSIDVLNQLKASGHEAYLNRSWRGKWIQSRAGVALYTNGLNDFGRFPLVGGAKIVALWHGMGFKMIYNGKYSGTSLNLKKVMDRLFSWTERNITISTSTYASQWMSGLFTMDKKNIFITGQPRNDVLRRIDRNAVLGTLGIDTSKKVILYMPTYRMAAMGKDAMGRIVKDLYDCEALSKALDDGNFIFVVKLHPMTPNVNVSQRDNFRILGYDEIEANQELLAAGDMLITDYSSCCVDFALLKRPVIFYQPDEEKFFKHSETVCDEFFDISSKNSSRNPEELVNLIRKSSLKATNAINDLYEDPSIKGTCYSENVYNVICKEMGI